MIKVSLNKEYVNTLFFDAVQRGRKGFVSKADNYTATLSPEEYDNFLKDNNMIPYKDQLKLYENGEIVGTFSSLEE